MAGRVVRLAGAKGGGGGCSRGKHTLGSRSQPRRILRSVPRVSVSSHFVIIKLSFLRPIATISVTANLSFWNHNLQEVHIMPSD